jgi:hypothetical protein
MLELLINVNKIKDCFFFLCLPVLVASVELGPVVCDTAGVSVSVAVTKIKIYSMVLYQ